MAFQYSSSVLTSQPVGRPAVLLGGDRAPGTKTSQLACMRVLWNDMPFRCTVRLTWLILPKFFERGSRSPSIHVTSALVRTWTAETLWGPGGRGCSHSSPGTSTTGQIHEP